MAFCALTRFLGGASGRGTGYAIGRMRNVMTWNKTVGS